MEDKKKELTKFYDLVLATLDYYIETPELNFQQNGFDSKSHFEMLKKSVNEEFKKGRLSKIKKWFKDLTEMQVETMDFKFLEYLKIKTGYEVNIFLDFYKRIEKIIAKGEIKTDNQYLDLNLYVDNLSQAENVDKEKIDFFNQLLLDYEAKKVSEKE